MLAKPQPAYRELHCLDRAIGLLSKPEGDMLSRGKPGAVKAPVSLHVLLRPASATSPLENISRPSVLPCGQTGVVVVVVDPNVLQR